MTNEILPCPFCGKEAYVFTDDKDTENLRYYIMCLGDSCGLYGAFDHEKEAIDAWNKRALSVREHEMIKALKNARQELLHSASGYTKNAIYAACAIQDLLWRIGGDKRD